MEQIIIAPTHAFSGLPELAGRHVCQVTCMTCGSWRENQEEWRCFTGRWKLAKIGSIPVEDFGEGAVVDLSFLL